MTPAKPVVPPASARCRATHRDPAGGNKLEVTGQLTCSMAHQVSTRLAAIVTSAQTILAFWQPPKGHEPAALRKDVELILAEAHRAENIVSSLLEFAEQQAGPRRPASIANVIERVSTLVRHHLDMHDIVLETPDPTLPSSESSSVPVEGDANQLVELLLNLVLTAQRAITSHGIGGIVWIKLAKSDTGTLDLTVENDGPGIPTEQLALGPCEAIAGLHGAEVRVENRLEGGARYVISFPTPAFTQAEPEKLPPSPPTAHPGESRETVSRPRLLMVDDEPAILRSVGRYLDASGYEVIPVTTGQEALDALSSETYDAIITDLRMPEISGEELFEAIRDEHPEMASRIVFTSGDMTREASREFLENSGCPHLQKPYELTDLLEILTTLHDPIAPSSS